MQTTKSKLDLAVERGNMSSNKKQPIMSTTFQPNRELYKEKKKLHQLQFAQSAKFKKKIASTKTPLIKTDTAVRSVSRRSPSRTKELAA